MFFSPFIPCDQLSNHLCWIQNTTNNVPKIGHATAYSLLEMTMVKIANE